MIDQHQQYDTPTNAECRTKTKLQKQRLGLHTMPYALYEYITPKHIQIYANLNQDSQPIGYYMQCYHRAVFFVVVVFFGSKSAICGIKDK